MRKEPKKKRHAVLVAVLKDWRDLGLLLHEHWYRIPIAHLPKRAFTHIAFYQPLAFGQAGKGINFYARVLDKKVQKRNVLLPDEPKHARADESYAKFTFTKIIPLKHPIKNVIPRRVSFGFTDLCSLRRAKDILELYHVPKTEQLVAEALANLGIEAKHEFTVVDLVSKKRVRIDLAIECAHGKIAIECDNNKAHKSKVQQKRDRAKDAMLGNLGWRVVRIREGVILSGIDYWMSDIQSAVKLLGGVAQRQ